MILIRNADLYNPQHIGLRDILVAGGQIVAIGEGLDDFPVDVERIDAAGGIVHPGFIDGHVHAIGGGGEAGMISRVPPLSEDEIAQAAVTGIVGVLGTDGRTRTVRDLLAKIKGYREWGLSAWALTGSYELPSQTITGSVGDDIALIEEIIGVKVAISDHRCSIPTTEELTRLAGEARVAGLLAGKCGIVHVHVGSFRTAIDQLFQIVTDTPLPVSCFYPTHMGGHLEAAASWLEIGGHVDITCSEKAVGQVLALAERHPEGITLSTDSNGSFPKWNQAKEIVGMDRGRISTLDETVSSLISQGLERGLAYSLVTSSPARWMRLAGKGRIGVGYDADIVIRDGQKVRYVISRGQVLVREGRVKSPMYD